MAAVLKRSPVLRHSISEGTKSGDAERVDSSYASSSASKEGVGAADGSRLASRDVKIAFHKTDAARDPR